MRNITNEQLNELINYLSKRPYAEVFGLIKMVLELPNAPQEKEEESK